MAFLIPLPVLIAALLAACTAQDIPEPPSILEPSPDKIPDTYIERGGTFQLPCEATGNPEPTYQWLLYGKEVHLSKPNIKQLENGTIEISDFQASDQGEYQCVASNKYGKSLSQIYKVIAAFIDESGHQEIETYPVPLGSDYVVSMRRVYINPVSSYELMTACSMGDLNPKTVDLNEHINIDTEGNIYFISVQASDALEDECFYKLVVHNAVLRHSLGVRYFRIAVDTSVLPTNKPPAPLYPKTSKTFHVLEGTRMRTPCLCSGFPLGNVTWTGPSQSPFTREDSGTALVLDRMTKEAEGYYICTCHNAVGTASVTISVEMQTIPKFTAEGRPSKQTLTEGETVTFTCQTTEDTNPQATVQWMINRVLVEDNSPGARTEVATIENGKTLTIRDLDRDVDMKVVQCKATNKHGTTYADAALTVLRRPSHGNIGMSDTDSRLVGVVVAIPILLVLALIVMYCLCIRNSNKDGDQKTELMLRGTTEGRNEDAEAALDNTPSGSSNAVAQDTTSAKLLPMEDSKDDNVTNDALALSAPRTAMMATSASDL